MASVRDRFKANKFDVLEKIQRYSIWFILVPSGMLCPISCNAFLANHFTGQKAPV